MQVISELFRRGFGLVEIIGLGQQRAVFRAPARVSSALRSHGGAGPLTELAPVEERADRLTGVDPADRLPQQRRDRALRKFGSFVSGSTKLRSHRHSDEAFSRH